MTTAESNAIAEIKNVGNEKIAAAYKALAEQVHVVLDPRFEEDHDFSHANDLMKHRLAHWAMQAIEICNKRRELCAANGLTVDAFCGTGQYKECVIWIDGESLKVKYQVFAFSGYDAYVWDEPTVYYSGTATAAVKSVERVLKWATNWAAVIRRINRIERLVDVVEKDESEERAKKALEALKNL